MKTQSANNKNAKAANNFLLSEWSETKSGKGIIISAWRRAPEGSGKKYEYVKIFVPLYSKSDIDDPAALATIDRNNNAVIKVYHKHAWDVQDNAELVEEDDDIPF